MAKALAAVCVAVVFIIYGLVDPANVPFTSCPILELTGFQCPGCGGQRALHAMLRLRIGEALALNPLAVIVVPYLVGAVVFHLSGRTGARWIYWRQRLYGTTAFFYILGLIILFTVLRNIG